MLATLRACFIFCTARQHMSLLAPTVFFSALPHSSLVTDNIVQQRTVRSKKHLEKENLSANS